ncbi:YncE family protein [Candidatus Acetothermia bacterium]|nr:YncE family protein [Candidatus Acetothermia bacterium]
MASSRISAAGVVLCILTWISSYSAGVIAQPFVYVSNSSDGTISKIDAACNLVVETMHFPMPGYQPMGIAVKPNGTQIYVTYSASVPGIIGSFVAVIDTNASSCSNQDNSPTNLVRIVDIVPIPSTSLSIAVNPQGTRLYISDGTLGTISVIHLDSIDYILNATINVCAQQPCGIANGLAISPDGKHLFVAVTSSGAPSGYISVINIEGDSNIILQPPLPIASNDSMRPDPQGIAVSPDGNRVYVSVRFPSGGPGRLDIFKKAGNTNSYAPETCPPTCSVSIPSLIGLGIVVNPAGTRVYVPGRSFINTRLTEIIFEPPLADPIRTFRLKGSSLHSIAMHPGGSYVYVPDAAGSSAQVINVIDESALGIEVPGLEIDVGNGPFAISEFTNYNGTGSVDGTSQNAWLLLGNGGTNPSVNFLGTTDPTALEIRVNGKRALRLEPASIPNIIGGDSGNLITTGTIGATIAGGGGGGMPNQVSGNFACSRPQSQDACSHRSNTHGSRWYFCLG